jgi:outer membrane protein TolC
VQALQIANADNETIASSGETYIQALAEKMRQAGTFLPTLNLGPSYTFTRSSGSGSSVVIPGTGSTGTGTGTTVISTGQSGTRHSTSVRATAAWTGTLSDISNLDAATLTAEQREQLLLDTRETVLLQVVQAYYDVLRNEQQVGVFQNSISLRQEEVRDQEARARLGNARPLDVAQGQSDLAAVRVSLAQARTDALNARSALARLMGVDAVAGPLTDAFAAPLNVGAVNDWREQAFQQRQDLIAAARATESARAGVESAIRQYFPSVSIDFNYFLYTDPKSSQKWTGGVSANIPIFSGLQIEADIRRAWSVYRQAGLAESATRRAVLDDITQDFQNLANSREKIQNLQVQVAAAQRAFDLSDRAYRLGSDTNLNRLTQQNNLLSAQLNLIDEQFNEKTNYLALLRAAGRLASVLGLQP